MTKPVNVRYLTGFSGSTGAALVAPDGSVVLATDGRYEERARREAPDAELLVTRDAAADLLRRAAGAGLATVAVEEHHLSVSAHRRLTGVADAVRLVDGGEPVERLRTVKDDEEIALLRRACAITDAVFAALLDELAPGRTEREVAWWLATAMRERGADGPAFDSIVAFGADSAVPHHNPSDRPLATGDLVKVDFGAAVDGYHADMTRTVVVGPAAEWQRELHALVAGVQAQVSAQTVAGAAPADLDGLARRLVGAAGEEMPHGLGHGVGLEIHESPFAVPGTRADRLVERVLMTVEPGVYRPGQGGVRIEDTVVVRNGPPESLTTSPRELIEI